MNYAIRILLGMISDIIHQTRNELSHIYYGAYYYHYQRLSKMCKGHYQKGGNIMAFKNLSINFKPAYS